MRSDIKFHCGEEYNFKDKINKVRAFLYKDYSIEEHSHDFYEVNIIFDGSGIHRIENSYIAVKPGDVFVIPPMALHAYYDTTRLDVYHILIRKEFIAQNATEANAVPGFVHLLEIEPFLRGVHSEKEYLNLSASELIALKSELAFIEENGIYDRGEIIAMKNHAMWKILYWFSDLMYRKMSNPERGDNKYKQAIIDTLEYMHRNPGEKITVESLCSRVYLSRSTFLRSFFEVCQCTPMKYLARYRCQRALSLMETEELSKTEIAHRCGFYDLSHMERMLRKI